MHCANNRHNIKISYGFHFRQSYVASLKIMQHLTEILFTGKFNISCQILGKEKKQTYLKLNFFFQRKIISTVKFLFPIFDDKLRLFCVFLLRQ